MKFNGIVMKLGSTIMVLFLIVLIPLVFIIDRIFLEIYTTQVHQNVNELSRGLTNTLTKIPNTDSEFYHYLSLITGKELVVFNAEGIITSNSVFEYKKGEPMPDELVR